LFSNLQSLLPISPLEIIAEHPGKARGISLFIKRDDLLHSEIEGSKGRKLLAILPKVKQAYPGGIVTFGGAFSNHLHAVAVAGRIWGFPTIGILRGEYADFQNPTLRFCLENGMRLLPMAKTRYDTEKKLGFESLQTEFPQSYLLPEGGNTPEAVEACKAISQEVETQLPSDIQERPIYLCTPAGTGCTAAGIIAGLSFLNSRALVFPVSNHDFDTDTLFRLLPTGSANNQRFDIINDYTYGGFAKFQPEVMAFVRTFFQQTNILLDPIYTAKMCFGVFDMLAKAAFAPNSVVVLLHTGGIQGWEGFRQRYGVFTSV
jgi:1-aminocyclopropane-1-carboxylate deaminase